MPLFDNHDACAGPDPYEPPPERPMPPGVLTFREGTMPKMNTAFTDTQLKYVTGKVARRWQFGWRFPFVRRVWRLTYEFESA